MFSCTCNYFSFRFSVLVLLTTAVKLPGQSLPEDFSRMPELNWKFSTAAILVSDPVVDGERVYIGGCDSILHAISLADGKELWKFHSGGEIRSEVGMYGSTVLLNGGDGSICALDKATGSLVWKTTIGQESTYDFADYFHSSPVVHGDRMYMGSGDHVFYCLSAVTGTVLWSFRTEGIIHTTAAVDGDKVFFGSFDGYVYALHTADGSLAWKFKTVGHRYFPRGEVQGSPVVGGGKVFIGARDYNIYAIDQEKGYCHWNITFRDGWGLCTSLHDGSLFIGSSDERVMLRVNPETGKEEWRKKMEFLVFGGNAYSRTMLCVGTTNGKLHGIDLETGDTRWSYVLESYRSHKARYFREDDSYREDIHSIIRSNEQFLEVEYELGGIFSSPVLAGNTLLFSSTDGSLYSLRPAR